MDVQSPGADRGTDQERSRAEHHFIRVDQCGRLVRPEARVPEGFGSGWISRCRRPRAEKKGIPGRSRVTESKIGHHRAFASLARCCACPSGLLWASLVE